MAQPAGQRRRIAGGYNRKRNRAGNTDVADMFILSADEVARVMTQRKETLLECRAFRFEMARIYPADGRDLCGRRVVLG